MTYWHAAVGTRPREIQKSIGFQSVGLHEKSRSDVDCGNSSFFTRGKGRQVELTREQ